LKRITIGKTMENITVKINGTLVHKLQVNAEVIAKESWVVPEIFLKSENKGVRILIKKNGYEQYFFINRSLDANSLHFISNRLSSETDPLDENAKPNQKYYYSLFSTNGRLEAGWSNQEEIIYNQLILTMDLKENAITNQSRFLITGSVTIGTELTINNQLVIVEKNGYFRTFVALKEGKNTLVFFVKDINKNQLEIIRTVILDTIPPSIRQIDPLLLDIQTTEKTYLIRFEVEKEAHVTIDNKKLFPKDDIFYEHLCSLEPGINSFTISANDRAGNQTIVILKISLLKKITSITLQVGSKLAQVNQQTINLDVPPQIIQGRTLVPIRFIADGFGAKVDWKADTKEILIQFYEFY
jgi:hypothetical protein